MQTSATRVTDVVVAGELRTTVERVYSLERVPRRCAISGTVVPSESLSFEIGWLLST
jgi:hypothetical protein